MAVGGRRRSGWSRARRRDPDRPRPARPQDRPGRSPRPIPTRGCELDFDDPFQLLVVTVLSAQTTDRRVNAARPALFAAYPDAARDGRRRPREHLEQIVGPLGFFRAKTDALLKLCAALVERYDGEVPAPARGPRHAARRRPQDRQRRARQRVRHPRHHRRHPLRPARAPLRLDRARPTRSRSSTRSARCSRSKDWTMLSHHLIWHGRRRLPRRASRPAAPARSPGSARRTARARPTRTRPRKLVKTEGRA